MRRYRAADAVHVVDKFELAAHPVIGGDPLFLLIVRRAGQVNGLDRQAFLPIGLPRREIRRHRQRHAVIPTADHLHCVICSSSASHLLAPPRRSAAAARSSMASPIPSSLTGAHPFVDHPCRLLGRQPACAPGPTSISGRMVDRSAALEGAPLVPGRVSRIGPRPKRGRKRACPRRVKACATARGDRRRCSRGRRLRSTDKSTPLTEKQLSFILHCRTIIYRRSACIHAVLGSC
jgi:hypothetical protein